MPTDFKAFIHALGGRWFTAMSGPLSVPFAFLALFLGNTGLKVLFGVLAVTCAVFSSYWVWRQERQRANSSAKRVEQLEERMTPRLIFVLRDGCCRRASGILTIGVGNENPRTVEDASVYVAIPRLQVNDRVLPWASPDERPQETLSVHQGGHHHTGVFASVGDLPGQFFFHFAYGHVSVEPGEYGVDLCVKGRDVMATTARMEIIFALPRSLNAWLIPSGDVKSVDDPQKKR